MRLGVSYIPSHQPIHLKADLEHMREIGCSDVLFAFQENHFQWLDGAVRFGAKMAKEIGLKPSALVWGYANTTGGGRSSRVMLENPDMWRCDENGQPCAGDYPNPRVCFNNHKAVTKYAEYIQQCVKYGFEGIMIDEPSFQDCFCRTCREKFFDKFGEDLVKSHRDCDNNYVVFQHDTVVDFVIRSLKTIKAIDENLETSVCIMPVDRGLFEDIAAIPELDIFATDPYWLRPINELTLDAAIEVTRSAKKLARINGKSFQLYLGCFGIAAGLEEQIYSGNKILTQECPDSLFTWSFRGGIGLAGAEECDNPELAWEKIVQLYKELS